MDRESWDKWYKKDEMYCDHCDKYAQHWIMKECDHERFFYGNVEML